MSLTQSWGYYPQAANQKLEIVPDRFGSPFFSENLKSLPRGLGRSYGDSCLNEGNVLLSTQRLDHFINFDRAKGILTCEAGVSFAEILKLIVPHGWFLPVTPGTKFISVGGAIANDVHGKNHHVAGNFGHHIIQFELLRSDGAQLVCSREKNVEMFYATVGGLGLTGFITWAQFKLKKITSAWIEQETIRFESLDEFFELSQDSMSQYDYTVSWVDCLNGGSDIRGLFMRGNPVDSLPGDNFRLHSEKQIKVPVFFPQWVLNQATMKSFNFLYFHKALKKKSKNLVHYDPFFYPLDSIGEWNKIYGRKGFVQYQFVVPFRQDDGAALKEIFKKLRETQKASFLAVLKTFGCIKSEGFMSFPKEGVTLALDFAVGDPKLFEVLETCDQIVADARGAVYPAKDARMSARSFKLFYPRLEEFKQSVDPQMSSSFWRRVL